MNRAFTIAALCIAVAPCAMCWLADRAIAGSAVSHTNLRLAQSGAPDPGKPPNAADGDGVDGPTKDSTDKHENSDKDFGRGIGPKVPPIVPPGCIFDVKPPDVSA